MSGKSKKIFLKEKEMKKVLMIFVALAVLLMFIPSDEAVAKKEKCPDLKSGTLYYSAGHYLAGTLIPVGYDAYGYNYQAHMFNGSYANAYLGRDGFPPYDGDDAAYLAANPGAESHWTWPYRETTLMMKWNDAWLSNKDCDNYGVLDRHYGYPSYIGSGAWLTNHMQGTCVMEVQKKNKTIMKEVTWTYFVKIIAVPEDAETVGGVWYTADCVEIGPVIWGQFAVIQEISNDPCYDEHGVLYKSPAGPGLGKWK